MKIHLLIASTPLAGERDLEAVCGVIVPQAQAVPMADFSGEQHSTILFCKKCFDRRYFYLISTAQEAHDIEVA